MALIVGLFLLGAGAVGGLITYTTVKALESPSIPTEHITALINNQVNTKPTTDENHEFFQTLMIVTAMCISLLLLLIIILKCIVQRFYVRRESVENGTVRNQRAEIIEIP